MKIKELREKQDKELLAMISELREKQRDASFKLAQNQMKDFWSKVKIKKEIARIMTILNERKQKVN